MPPARRRVSRAGQGPLAGRRGTPGRIPGRRDRRTDPQGQPGPPRGRHPAVRRPHLPATGDADRSQGVFQRVRAPALPMATPGRWTARPAVIAQFTGDQTGGITYIAEPWPKPNRFANATFEYCETVQRTLVIHTA